MNPFGLKMLLQFRKILSFDYHMDSHSNICHHKFSFFFFFFLKTDRQVATVDVLTRSSLLHKILTGTLVRKFRVCQLV